MSASGIKAAIVQLLAQNFTQGADYNGSTLQNVTNQWLRYLASTRTPQAVVRDMSWHEAPLAAGKVNQPVRRRDYQFLVRVVQDGSQADSDTFDTLIDNIITTIISMRVIDLFFLLLPTMKCTACERIRALIHPGKRKGSTPT